MIENPNKTYRSENTVEKRDIFHCANQMRKYVKWDIIDMWAWIWTITDFFTKNNINVQKILCVDFSSNNLKLIKEKWYDFKELNLDLPSYDLESEKYNTVISTDVLEHLISPYGYLSECYRILKKDWYLIIATPDAIREKITIPHINFFSSQSFEKYLMRTWFKKKNIKRFYNWILNPKITFIFWKIPILRNFFNFGLYYVCKK